MKFIALVCLLLESQKRHRTQKLFYQNYTLSLFEWSILVGSMMVLYRRAAGEIRQIWTIIFGLPKKTFPVDLFPSYLLKLYEKKAGVEREITNILWRNIYWNLYRESNSRSYPCSKCLPTSHSREWGIRASSGATLSPRHAGSKVSSTRYRSLFIAFTVAARNAV